MIYGSVCSGIEAATVAWHPLGWRPSFFSEIEAFPRSVLAHHYPNVPLHGDFTTIGADQYEPIDLLVGGTPCQSFSVAGLRGGLADGRGNLALEFLRLADRTRPRWLVWENVPGVLSSAGGRDFGAILGGMVELGYGFAYRVLDAQHFGVPQRRRRVFVVGYLGDWRPPAAVLFERHSLSGHPAPRRQAREGAAGVVARSVAIRGRDGVPQAELGDELANAILTPNGGRAGVGVGAVLTEAFGGGNTRGALDVAACLVAKGQKCDFEVETFIAHALRGEGFDASEDGTGRRTPLVPVPFDTTQITSVSNYSNPKPGDACHPLAAGAHPPAVAFTTEQTPKYSEGAALTLTKQSPTGGGQIQSVMTGSAVRRLTPRECERLQGFPDDYTLVTHRGKPAADGPRYRALGNSMAVPVMAWIGERIALVDSMGRQMERAA